MTYQEDFTLPTELLEQLSTEGFEFLPELIRILVNAAMRIESRSILGQNCVCGFMARSLWFRGFKYASRPSFFQGLHAILYTY